MSFYNSHVRFRRHRRDPARALTATQKKALLLALRYDTIYSGWNPGRGGAIISANTLRSLERLGLVTTQYVAGDTVARLTPNGVQVAKRLGVDHDRDPARPTFAERLYETRLARESVNTDFLPLFDHLMSLARDDYKRGDKQEAGRLLAKARKLTKYGRTPNYREEYGGFRRWDRKLGGRGVDMFSRRVTSTATERGGRSGEPLLVRDRDRRRRRTSRRRRRS